MSSADGAAAELLRKSAPRKAQHRVLGWPESDTDAFEDDMVLLLALGSDPISDMCWGDAGRLYFTLRRDHLARSDFTRVEVLHTM